MAVKAEGLISKSIVVLKRTQLSYTVYSNFIPFEYAEEETGVISRTLILTRKETVDLGWPEAITVTIEPGDRLNLTD